MRVILEWRLGKCLDLYRLTAARLEDARILLHQNRAQAAYYLAGYAVECALKACIARKTALHEFPDMHHARKSCNH